MQFKAELKDHGDHRVVRLSGALKGEMSSELTRLLEGILPPVQLDLAELVSADGAGLTTLASLEARGAELVGASPYVSLQLHRAGAQGPHELRGPSHHRVTHEASKPASHARKKEDR